LKYYSTGNYKRKEVQKCGSSTTIGIENVDQQGNTTPVENLNV
jgi:hypothetical protein